MTDTLHDAASKQEQPIDVLIRDRGPSPWLFVLMIGLMILIGAVPEFLRNSSADAGIGIVVGLMLTSIAALPLRSETLKNRALAAGCRNDVQADPRRALPQLFGPDGDYARLAWGNRSGRSKIIDVIAGAGLNGHAVRIGTRPAHLAKAVDTMTVRFEPVPLDETDRGFLELASPAEDATGQPGAVPAGTMERRRLRRILPRPVLTFVLWAWLFYSVWPMRPAALLPLLVILAIGVVPACRELWHAYAGLPAYVFPGGVIDTSGRRVFRRESGIMIWDVDGRWMTVTDTAAAEVFSTSLTSEEGLFAVRAWLSPVSSPSDEMLDAFLGRPVLRAARHG